MVICSGNYLSENFVDCEWVVIWVQFWVYVSLHLVDHVTVVVGDLLLFAESSWHSWHFCSSFKVLCCYWCKNFDFHFISYKNCQIPMILTELIYLWTSNKNRSIGLGIATNIVYLRNLNVKFPASINPVAIKLISRFVRSVQNSTYIKQ